MIQYAILGLLSWKPLSGYDLKKIISNTEVFYWSGNNNQIYKSLIQLHQEGMVSQQVKQQESLPAKKIYSITEKGRDALRKWVISTAEIPEFRSTFLIQLAWGDQLSDEDLDSLLTGYEDEIDIHLKMLQEKARRQSEAPNRTKREAFLWEKISEHSISIYQHEIDWVCQIRKDLTNYRRRGKRDNQ
jgi:DNA-binding PadR family transcriptional regulator